MRVYLNEHVCQKLGLDYFTNTSHGAVYIDAIDILYYSKSTGGLDSKHMAFFGSLVKSGITRVKYVNEGYGWFKSQGAILK